MARHICIISTEILGWGKAGGYGFVVRSVGRELVNRGYKVTVIIPQPRDVAESRTNLDGIDVWSYRRLDFKTGMRLFREANADVYHAQEPSIGAWLARRTMPDRRHIMTSQDPRQFTDWLIEMRYPTYSFFQVAKTVAYYENPLTYSSVRNADRVFVPAHFLKPIVKRKYRLKTTPEFMPTPVRVPESVRKAAQPTVCYLGRLDRRKRPEEFLSLAPKFPGIKFICIGDSQDKEYEKNLRATYEKLNNIEFMGFIDQFKDSRVSDRLSEAWALVNTSAREGLPNTFFEASGHRCAIISSVDPDNFASSFGIHVPDRDFERGLRLLLDGDEWRAKADAGYEYVLNNYELGAAIQKQIEAYENSIADAG